MSYLDVQKALKAKGYPVGALDGLYGPVGEAALLRAIADASPGSGPQPAHPNNMAVLLAKQPFAARPINGIVIHCTATPEGRDHSVAEIRRWHTGPPNYWADIGYHYVVHLDGSVEAGRPEAKVGAHVKEANTGTLGVVYVGGVDAQGKPKDTRTPEQKRALMDLCRALMVKYPKINRISGHNDWTNAKACPSFKVGDDPLGHLA